MVGYLHDLGLRDGVQVWTCVKIDQLYEVYGSSVVLDAVPKKRRYSLTQQLSFLVKYEKC